MSCERVMDAQRDNMIRLESLYQNFKKERLERRNQVRKERYEADRSTLWSYITRDHAILLKADPPDRYHELYTEAVEINNKFIERLTTWIPTEQSQMSPQSILGPFIEKNPVLNIPTTSDLNVQTSSLINLKTPTTSTSISLPPTTVESKIIPESSIPMSFPSTISMSQTISTASITTPLPSVTTTTQPIVNTAQNLPQYISQSMITPSIYGYSNITPTRPSYNIPPIYGSDSHMSSRLLPLSTHELPQVSDTTSKLERLIMMMAESQLASQSMKPPEIKVKEFSGDVQKYREFKEIFGRSLRNTKWNNVELFIYLQSKLKGEAFEAIKNIAVDDNSYTLAWEVLEKKYSNRRQLLKNTTKMIIDPKIKMIQHDISSAKNFYTSFETILANLRQLRSNLDEVIMELMIPKLDDQCRSRLQDFVQDSTTTATFSQLSSFIQKEIAIWEEEQESKPKAIKATKVHITNDSAIVNKSNKEVKCFICNKNHMVLQCDQFLGSEDRETLLRRNRICIYCTKHKYQRYQLCRDKAKLECDICHEKHLTLLHPLNENEQKTTTLLTQESSEKTTLLPTAIACIIDSFGKKHMIRCLIDLCAERSYVCEHVAQKLRLKKSKAQVTITGINGIQGKAKSMVKLEIALNDVKLENIVTDAIVVPRITGHLPTAKITDDFSKIKENLADPHLDKSGLVGALLGGDIAGKLFMTGVPNKITPNGYLLQPTHLGWIVAGSSAQTNNYVSTFITMNENIEKLTNDHELTQRIMEFYEIPNKEDNDTADNEYCEKVFKEKHYRTPNGRYVVPIPWKPHAPKLGHSFRKAIRIFKSQEHKWMKNSCHYDMSNNFMIEYETLGHMTRVEEKHKSDDSGNAYYIPYLSIVRENSLTTKLRNVFNASMPSSNGISLNDTMYEGPKLQTAVKDLILTARSFKYIYSADISKMFRQILVIPSDRDKLRIIWRPNSNETIREYQMNTVTYGTDSAPYLAIRTIHQCADDNASPEISSIIKKAFYVDDLLYGADTIELAKTQISAIKNALSAGEMPLVKWMSNCSDTLEDIDTNDKITSLFEGDTQEVKLLGVTYNFGDDNFGLKLEEPKVIKNTKRGISSVAASFYDPLGFILPFVMMLRIFLQNVWKFKVDWDEPLNDNIKKEFHKCIANVLSLNSIKIPRYLPSNDENIMEIIGFSDASTHAQAAVLYSRVKLKTGYKVTLLTAKGNVAKTKTKAVVDSKQTTIPKLELEALLTLAELFKTIKECFSHRILKFTGYTDSQIALAWIRSKKRIDKRFVERRVTKIKEILDPNQIHYVRSEDNPADPASRGLSAQQLSDCSLWFNGPSWLNDDELPVTPSQTTEVNTLLTSQTETKVDIFSKYSKWGQLLRIVAYCLRWRYRTTNTYLKAEEITRAKLSVIRYYQQLILGNAMDNLYQGKLVPKRHWLYNLSPFIDKRDNVLRVGGRLLNATHLSESQRQPIIFPKCHGLNIYIRFLHLQNGHAGNTLMLRLTIENYWVPGIRNVISQTIRKCTTCLRWNARSIQPEMSQLPRERITPTNTFEKVGVDLCGPFTIKASPLRFDKCIKVWIANFVCLSTKAVHLEIVTNLSSENFLAAFSRLCARRGTASEIWSDNGTNFIGANRMFKEAWKKLLSDCEKRTAIQEINWKFIPRHSPTFGGLWEACVKSLKYFVKRMSAVQNLTYEEFLTLLCQVEALLNSRPICKNPLNPEDSPALTPFHFLNQRGYKPSPIVGSEKVPLTKKWIVMHQIQLQFWERFRTEYLRELQVKTKWQKPQPNINVEDIVLIKEPSLTPGDWKMGRVVKIYPDPKGVVRKVDVITQSKSNSLHAVNQLVPLLKESDDISNTTNDDYTENPLQCEPKNEKTLRKSPRLNPTITLLQLCLLTLTVICSPVTCSTISNPITNLNPGIHIVNNGPIYLHAFEIPFSVKTNLNMTADILLINKYLNEFTTECNRLIDQNVSVTQLCDNLIPSIKSVGLLSIKEIQDSYKMRIRRWIAPLAKGIVYAAPTLLGMGYQQIQISKLQDQVQQTQVNLQRTQLNLQKVVSVVVNETNLEFVAVEEKLNEIITKQQQIIIEDSLTSYVQQLELLFQKIKSQHIDITNISPLEELNKVVNTVTEKIPNVVLPNIGNEIFNIFPPTKSIVNEITVVSFNIVLVQKRIYNLWTLISIPNYEHQFTVLPNNQKVQQVITDNSNTTIADVNNTSKIHRMIMENVKLHPMSKCHSNIFNNLPADDVCTFDTNNDDSELIIPLSNDTVILYRNDNTKLECNKSIYSDIVFPVSLVNVTACTIFNNQNLHLAAQPITTVLEEPYNRDIKFIIKSGVSQLESTKFADNIANNLKDINNQPIIIQLDDCTLLIAVFIISGFMILIIFITMCKKSESQDRWSINWEGPTRDQTEGV